MKKIILIILLLTVSLFATDRYLTLNGAGNQSGSSWTNADSWNSISFWGSCTGGDRIFISGGAATDSVVYTTQLLVSASGTWGHYLEILPGKYSPSPSGHSGKVIIDQNLTSPTTETAVGIQIGNSGYSPKWVYIKGFTVRHSRWYNVWFVYAPNHCVLDSCEIYEAGQDQEVAIFGIWPGDPQLGDTNTYVHHIEIKNCKISSWHSRNRENDVIMIQAAADIWIHHNFLHQRNHQEGVGSFHIDCIQTQNAVAGTKIYNNIAIVDSGVNGHCFILGEFSRGANHDTLLVYNNYLYNGGSISLIQPFDNNRGVLLWRGSESGQANDPICYGINNTIVTSNGTCTNSKSDDYQARESNNLFVQTGQAGGTPAREMDIWGATYGSSNNKYIDSCHTNLVWRNYPPYDIEFGNNDWYGNGTPNLGPFYSWAEWVSAGGDGVNANPKLVGDYQSGLFKGEIEATSPAINAGTNMSYLIENRFGYLPDMSTNDIRGNPRGATWDIGVYEYSVTGWSTPDTIPSFSFTALTGREKNTEYVASSIFTCNSPDSTFHVWTTTGAEFKIGTFGTYSTAMKTAISGDYVYVKNQSDATRYLFMTTETIVGGGYPRDFNVTTKADPGGVTVGGGWVSGSNGRMIYLSNDHALITKQP